MILTTEQIIVMAVICVIIVWIKTIYDDIKDE